MEQITIRLQENTIESLEEEAADAGVSRSEYLRDVIESRQEADRLRRELEVTENRLQEAREQMKHREQLEEKVDLLATTVEEEQRAADAPFFVRWARWWRRSRSAGEADGAA